MNNVMKPVIVGSLIIAVGTFLGALRIAYVLSLEGKVDSCEKILTDNAASLGLPSGPDAAKNVKKVCIATFVLPAGSSPD
jgi:hypothetical protein